MSNDGIDALPAPSKSTVPPDMVDSPIIGKEPRVDTAVRDGRAQTVASYKDVPGHGDNGKEIKKAYRADFYIQYTPAPGRILTVTDPADPLLTEWSQRQRKVNWVERNAEGDVTMCRSVSAEEARSLLRGKIGVK